MKSYVYATDDGQLMSYGDRWGWRWLLSVLYPLIPLVTIAVAEATGWRMAFWLPFVVSYGVIPLLDWLFGTDTNNPPEAVVRELEREPFYRWLTYVRSPCSGRHAGRRLLVPDERGGGSRRDAADRPVARCRGGLRDQHGP